MAIPILGAITGIVGKVLDKVLPDKMSDEEKALVKVRMAELMQARDSELEQTIRSEMQSKERVIVAELTQSDTYTKRARPTVVYAGLAIAAINHVVLPWVAHFVGQAPPQIDVPIAFWTAWGGICATWVIGRTAEKRGVQNKMVSLITGS